MNNYNKPIEKTDVKSIAIKNIGPHSYCEYDLSFKDGKLIMNKIRGGLLHEIYVDKYINIINNKLNDVQALTNCCKSINEQCAIHLQFVGDIHKSATLILYRSKPENNRLQLNYGKKEFMLKLDKSNLELLQLINGLIHI